MSKSISSSTNSFTTKSIDSGYSVPDLTQGGTIDTNNLIIDTDNSEALLIRQNNDAGDVLSVNTLTNKLKYTDGSQTNGYYLQCDANGTATWAQVAIPPAQTTITLDDDLSLNFTNDTDTGIQRNTNGFALVKDGTDVINILSGEAYLNNKLNLKDLTLGNVQTQFSASGLLGYYDFNTDIYTDESGSGFDMTTIVGTAPIITDFSGRTNVLQITGATANAVYTSSVTSIQSLTSAYISFWIYASANPHDVISIHDGTSVESASNAFRIRTTDATTLSVDDGDTNYTLTLSFNNWNHVVLQISSAGQKAWVNNVQIRDEEDGTRNFSSFTITRFVLGEEASPSANNTYLDSVAIFSGLPDATIVSNLYNNLIFGTILSSSPQSRLFYDSTNSLTSLEMPSGTNIWNTDGTNYTISVPPVLDGGKPVTLTAHNAYTTPTARYDFSSDATDTSGNSYTLSATGSPTFTSIQGRDTLSLGGSAYYSNVALGSAFNDVDLCVSLWFNTSSTTDAIGLISFDEQVSSTNKFLYIIMRSGLTLGGNPMSGDLQFTSAGAVSATTTDNGYNDGKWHHVVANYTSTGLSVWIDGVSKTLNFLTGTGATNAQIVTADGVDIFYIGTNLGVINYTGYLSNLILQQTPFTGAQALALYNGLNITGDKVTIPELQTEYITTSGISSVSTDTITFADGNEAEYNILVSNSSGIVSNAQYSSTENLTGNYAGALTIGADIQLSRIGTQVVMTITDTGAQTASASASITYSSISSQFRPLNEVRFPIYGTYSSSTGSNSLYLIVGTDGVITINRVGDSAFTAVAVRVFGFSCSWNVL